MKKIFTFFTIAGVALSMSAESNLTLLFGEDKEDLQVVDPAKTYSALMEDEYTQNAYLYLRGEKGTEVSVTVTSTDPEHQTQFCGITGQCDLIPEDGLTKTGTLGESLGLNGFEEDDIVTADLQIDRLWFSGDPEEITVKVVAQEVIWDKELEEEVLGDPVEATVLMLNTEVGGISSVVLNKDSVKLINSNTLAYNVSNPTTLKVYGITGSMAAKYTISGTGTLNLNNLAKGIYVYTDGNLKGKFVIR